MPTLTYKNNTNENNLFYKKYNYFPLSFYKRHKTPFIVEQY